MTENVTKKQAGSKYPYAIVASCIAMTGIPCALVLSCAGIFYTPVSTSLGVARSEFTLYFTILNLAMMVTLPIWGKALSSVPKRVGLSAAVVLCGLGLLGMSAGQELWHFYVCGAFLGAGLAPLLYLAVPALINAWFAERVGFFVGLCMAFTGIGGVIFNLVGSAIIATGSEGWRLGYLVFAVITLACTLPLTLFVVRDTPAQKGLLPVGATEAAHDTADSVEGLTSVDGVSAKDAMRSPAFYALLVFCGLITLNQNVFQLFPSYAESFKETVPAIAAAAGVVASIAMGGQALGKVILGAINDRSVHAGILFGICSGAVGVTLMMLVPQEIALLMVGAFLFGFSYAMTTVQTPLLVRSVFGNADYANIYSRVSMAGTLVGAIAVPALSLLAEQAGSYAPVFGVSYASLAICLVLSFFSLARRPHKK